MTKVSRKISELPADPRLKGAFTIGVNPDGKSVKVPLDSFGEPQILGGKTGQVLAKKTDADNDFAWKDLEEYDDTELREEIAKKVDKTYVDTEVAKKQNKLFVATPYRTTYAQIQTALAEGRTVIANDDEEQYILLGTYDGYTFARLIANGAIWGYHVDRNSNWDELNDYMLFTEQNMTDLLQEIQKKADQSTTYTKTEVDTKLGTKANDSGVVHKTGNETISGRKTFKDPIIMEAKQDSDESWQLTSEIMREKNVMLFQGTLSDVIIRGVGAPELSSDAVNLEYLEEILEDYADDNSVVHKYGVETIRGEKYFKDGFKADSLIGQQIALLNEDQSIDNINILNSSTDDDFIMELMDDLVNQPVIVRGVKSPKGDSDATNKKYVDDKFNESVHKSGNESISGFKIFQDGIETPSVGATNGAYIEFGTDSITLSDNDGNLVNVGVAEPEYEYHATTKKYVDSKLTELSRRVGDNASLVTPTKTDLVSAINEAYNHGGGGGSVNVVDNLTSDSATDALSAKQGKVLDGKLSELENEISGKQDTIPDLADIRSGAAKGATALQNVPSTYRTAAQQDAIHDSTKADKATTYTKSEVNALIPVVPVAEINANTQARHTHSNKAILDRITKDPITEHQDISGLAEKSEIKCFVITEDMFTISTDATKGVTPYNTSYGYTNVDIKASAGINWVEGALYVFVLNTKVATSAYRNVRVRIGTGDYKPLMNYSSTILSGSTYFVKASTVIFQYKSTYQANGALHMHYDANTNTYQRVYRCDTDVDLPLTAGNTGGSTGSWSEPTLSSYKDTYGAVGSSADTRPTLNPHTGELKVHVGSFDGIPTGENDLVNKKYVDALAARVESLESDYATALTLL